MKISFLVAVIVSLIFSSCTTKDDNLKRQRNNWAQNIYCDNSQYKFSTFGGINEFEIPIQNNTEHIIDEVRVRVSYIKQSGKTYKTEEVTLYNIQPYSAKTVRAPKSNRGTSVDLRIVGIQSRDLKLCVPSNGMDASDPYRCY